MTVVICENFYKCPPEADRSLTRTCTWQSCKLPPVSKSPLGRMTVVFDSDGWRRLSCKNFTPTHSFHLEKSVEKSKSPKLGALQFKPFAAFDRAKRTPLGGRGGSGRPEADSGPIDAKRVWLANGSPAGAAGSNLAPLDSSRRDLSNSSKEKVDRLTRAEIGPKTDRPEKKSQDRSARS